MTKKDFDLCLSILKKENSTHVDIIKSYKEIGKLVQLKFEAGSRRSELLLNFMYRDFVKITDGRKQIIELLSTWSHVDVNTHSLSIPFLCKIIILDMNAEEMNSLTKILKFLIKNFASNSHDIQSKVVNSLQTVLTNTKESLITEAVGLNIAEIEECLFDYNLTLGNLVNNVKCIEVSLILTHNKLQNIRKKSCNVLQKQLECCKSNSTYLKPLINPLKQVFSSYITLCSSESSLLCEFLQSQCTIILNFLGIRIKLASRLINLLLHLLEKGFRDSMENVKVASFQLWKQVIQHFSTDLKVISSERFIKLFLQPLQSSHCNSELVTKTRIETNWLLVLGVQDKLSEFFSSICLPYLYLSLGSLRRVNESEKTLGSPKNLTPNRRSSASSEGNKFHSELLKLGLKLGSNNKPFKFKSAQILGAEMLAHFLDSSLLNIKEEIVEYEFSLEKLKFPLLKDIQTFSRYGLLFIESIGNVVICLGNDISIKLLQCLWHRLHFNVSQFMIENVKKKKKDTEVFNSYLQLVRTVVMEKTVPISFAVNIIHDCSRLPSVILTSTFFGDSLNKMNGTPALCLLQILFSKSLLGSCSENYSILSCSNLLMSYCMKNTHTVFMFNKAMCTVFKSYYCESLNKLQIDILLKSWNTLAELNTDYVKKTQEINEGDAADHDFKTFYDMLVIPYHLTTSNSSSANANINISKWSDLYNTFVWASNLVSTTTPNEVCSDLSRRLMSFVGNTSAKTLNKLFSVSLPTMISNIDLSFESKQSTLENCYNTILQFKHSKNILDLCKLLCLCIEDDYLSLADSKYLFHCISDLFKKVDNTTDVLNVFLFFIPQWIYCFDTSQKSEFESIKENFYVAFITAVNKARKCIQDSGDNLKDNLIKCSKWQDMLLRAIFTKEESVVEAILDFYCTAVVKNSSHKEITDSFSKEVKENLIPFYKDFKWQCPWRECHVNLSKSITEGITATHATVPTAAYGAYSSPLKRTAFSPKKRSLLSPSPKKKSKNSKPKLKTKTSKTKSHPRYVKINAVQRSSAPLTEHQKDVKENISYIPTLYNDLDNVSEKKDPFYSTYNDVNDKQESDKMDHGSTDIDELKNKKRSGSNKKKKGKENRSINSVNNELGVVPLDDSYEYVTIADSSVNPVNNDSNVCEKNEIESLDSTPDVAHRISTDNEVSMFVNSEMDDSGVTNYLDKTGTNNSELSDNIDDDVSYVSKVNSSNGNTTSIRSYVSDTSSGSVAIISNSSDDNELESEEGYSVSGVSDCSSVNMVDMSCAAKVDETCEVSKLDSTKYNDTTVASKNNSVSMVDMSCAARVDRSSEVSKFDSANNVSYESNNSSINMVDMSCAAKVDETCEVSKLDSTNNVSYVSNNSSVDMVDMSCAAKVDETCEISKLDSTKNSLSDTYDNSQAVNNTNNISSSTDTSVNMVDTSCAINNESNIANYKNENSASSYISECSMVNMVDMSCAVEVNKTDLDVKNRDVCTGDTENEVKNKNNVSKYDIKQDINNSLLSSDQDEDINSDDDNIFSDAHSTLRTSMLGASSTESAQSIDNMKSMFKETSPISTSKNMPTRTNKKEESPNESPNSRSILKRRLTAADVGQDTPSPLRRRVSFAYPISVSKEVNKLPKYVTSPKSSIDIKKIYSPKSVNRKLYTGAEKQQQTVEDKQRSPLSLRSAKVAAAIVGIRAREGKESVKIDNLIDDNRTVKSTTDNIDDDLKFLKGYSPKKLARIIVTATKLLVPEMNNT